MKKILVIAILFLIVGGALFYWYEYRPAQARKECHDRYWRDTGTEKYILEFETCMNGFGLTGKP
ncbi:MAG TPA: hypothetical protein VGE53_02585 [Candidatus Paceibacterota bacterium]